MTEIKTVAVIGMGAIGCSFWDQMAKYLPPEALRVVAAGERARRYREEGIVINGAVRRVNVAEPGAGGGPADLVLISVKYGQLMEAMELIREQVGPGTQILSLLNGITSEEELAERYGWERVLYSLVIATDAHRREGGANYSVLGTIPFGEARNRPGAWSPRVEAVDAFLDRVGIPHEVPEDMRHTLWRKFMFNVGINQASAVLRGTYGVFQRVPEARRFMVEAMEEVIAVGARRGVTLEQADVDYTLGVLDSLPSSRKTSMLQDFDAMAGTEVEIFSGAVVRMGEQYGVDVPVNHMLYRIIKLSEAVFAHARENRQ